MKNFKLLLDDKLINLEAKIEHIYICGYTSSNQQALQDHIDELKKIGVTPPDKTPMLYKKANLLYKKANLSPAVNTGIRVISDDTSGEVEYFLLLQNDKIYLGLASDHTDRGIEKHDVEKSKQVCPVVLSDIVWDYSEIKEWKSLTLKSWAAKGNEKILYQEASLEIFMKPEEIIDFVKEEIQSDVNNSIILCGTPPLIPEQIIYTNKFYCELSNGSGMKISLEYEISRI